MIILQILTFLIDVLSRKLSENQMENCDLNVILSIYISENPLYRNRLNRIKWNISEINFGNANYIVPSFVEMFK